MLIAKHLKPWLLTYLIVCIVLILLTVALNVIININKVNGLVDFSVYNLLGVCSTYSYIKIQNNGQNIMKICFVLSVLCGVCALGQLIFVIYQFVVFRKKFTVEESNEQQQEPFKLLTIKKLIALYVMNAIGLLCMIIVFGQFLSFYRELNTACQPQQSTSASAYLIPFIIASIILSAQLVLFIFTMKFVYDYRQLEDNEEADSQKERVKQQRELAEMQGVKKRILQSRKLNNSNKNYNNSNYQTHYPQTSTQQQTPRDIQDELLDKMYEADRDYSKNNSRRDNSIYDDNHSFNNIQGNKNNNNKLANTMSHMSPNSISAKQKELMKTLPKHPFKKANNNSKFGPNDVIFEETYSEEDGSLDQQYQFHDDQNNFKLQNSNKQQPFQLNNKNKPAPKGNQQANKQKQQQSISQIFRQRYLHSPYLKHLQNKNITPQQRRKIKRPFLKLTSQLFQIDSRDEFINNSTFYPDNNSLGYGNVSAGENKSNQQQQQQYLMTKSNTRQKPPQTPKQQHQQQIRNLSKSHSTSYYIQKSLIQGKKHQDQNPILNYVNDDQTHEDKINRILDFEKLSKKRRRSFATNPFFPYNDQQDPGKLYLHKNNHNAGNFNKGNGLYDNQEEEGYDPFRDQTYDNEHLSYRGLMGDDELRSSGAKNTSNKNDTMKRTTTKDIQVPITAKKPSRKDAQLLDFIRSKHVVD